MTHRGGIAADGKTGDGCGLLIQKPDRFFRRLLQEDFNVTLTEHYAVGSIFLSQDWKEAANAQAIFEKAMAREGLSVVAWREVPTNPECLGPIALESVPQFKQVFINCEEVLTQAAFLAKLLIARRDNKQLRDDDIFVWQVSALRLSLQRLDDAVDCPVSSRTSPTPKWKRPFVCSISVFPPIPCPVGPWRSPSVCWSIMRNHDYGEP